VQRWAAVAPTGDAVGRAFGLAQAAKRPAIAVMAAAYRATVYISDCNADRADGGAGLPHALDWALRALQTRGRLWPSSHRFALVLATSACATDVDGDLDRLDGLAPYAGDSGSTGKSDDANCTDESYRMFIKAYRQHTITADENPCTSGNDASYRIWLAVFWKEMGPFTDAYDEVIQARARGAATPEQVAAAGTMTDALRTKLAELALVKPIHAGRVAESDWAVKYSLGLLAASTSTGNQFAGPNDQAADEILPFEDEWLTEIEKAQPTLVEAGAFELTWRNVGDPFETRATGEALDRELAFISRLANVLSTSTFDADNAMFQTRVTATLVDESTTLAFKVGSWTKAVDRHPAHDVARERRQ
jgi:hypothetical protein